MARIIIKLQSTESSEFYTSTKNPKNSPEKKELKKYDRKLKKHVIFKETKIK